MIQTEDDGSAPDTPHLRLAIAIVEQALSDIHRYGRQAAEPHRGLPWNRGLQNAKACADDARDFLLHRLWEPNNPFGDLLRHHGVGRMTTQRLIHGTWSQSQS